MIRADGLRLQAGGRVLLEGGSLAVAPGERVLITGPNGAGKSLLAQVLVGLSPGGQVTVNGAPVRGSKGRRQVGYLPQGASLYGYLTVEENLSFFTGLAGLPRRAQAKVVRDLLELVGLIRLAGEEASRLTPGQRQRLAVARALAADPPALVLDDPLAGLDAEGRADLHHLLDELAAMGKAILILAGDADVLAHDRHLILADGALKEVAAV